METQINRRNVAAICLAAFYLLHPADSVNGSSASPSTSLCSFPLYSLTGQLIPTCGTFASPWDDKEFWQDYDVYVKLICPGGVNQNDWDHQTIRTEGVGECGVVEVLYPPDYQNAVGCPPEFGTPVSSQSPIVSGKHQWSQAVRDNGYWGSPPLGLCVKSSPNNFFAYRGPAVDCENPGYCPQPCSGQEQDIEWCNNGESTWWDYDTCQCITSPVILDVSGNGFSLTNRSNGVAFDLDQDGVREQIPWTSRRSDDSWMVLDRNGNGAVDDGSELFGNFSPQQPSSTPNGFAALALFDANGDGWIDRQDPVYGRLLLWHDEVRDGVSESSELQGLGAAGVIRISVEAQESRRRDQWGNLFRYRARTIMARERGVPRFAFDVFFPVDVPAQPVR